ncbi:unnamed protein product, partial [Allacma fusca]
CLCLRNKQENRTWLWYSN